MHRTFIEAFSDYKVNMKMSREAFEDRMLSKLNIEFEISPGIYSGDKLVGFIFQSMNTYEGQLAAYNGGTGVIPGYTGQGLTGRMYDFILPEMKKRGIEKCVLEVLTDNARAISAYENAGFERGKTFQCFMLKDGRLNNIRNLSDRFSKVLDFSIEEYSSIGEIQPGMLDQLSQIKHHLAKESILEFRKGDELLAYIIFQPGNGRIAQLAVRPEFRRQGIAGALVYQAQQLCESKALSVLNIETKQEGVINFFTKLGFGCDLLQFEMQKKIADV
ncbi:MAG: GNAT family N-acetyltransferase [Reichenbachiella sp.]|uniref:GNAT family N-acetyltransferase n=1 Tax=Reichenbachiella sp. TaxID=2184521 RepID=UPI003265ABD0